MEFWDKNGDKLYNSILQSKEEGILAPSQTQSIIKLIPKKDRDKQRIQNSRPISLVNGDTKGVTKTLATSLKTVLPSIIHSDQTAYVYGRFIGESTRLISDIMELTRSLDLEGYLVTMDIQKSFDSVSHDFLILF